MYILTTAEELFDENFGVASYQNNFILVLGTYVEKDFSNILSMNQEINEKFVIFYKDGTDIEDYEDDDSGDITLVPCAYITEALSHIVEITMKSESINTKDEQMDYSPGIMVAAENSTGSKLISYLNKNYREKHSQIEPIHLIRYFKYNNLTKLEDSMKKVLNTEFIMKSEPLPFNYAVNTYLNS